MKKIAVISVFLLSILACKDKENCKPFELVDFPISVDSKWTYQIVDIDQHTTDTVELEIISESVNNGQTTFTSIISQNNLVLDTALYSISDTLIRFESTNQNYSHLPDYMLKIPFQPGSEWTGAFSGDNYDAKEQLSSMGVLGNTYSIVYSIERNSSSPNFYVENKMYICPAVGIIHQTINSFDGLNLKNQEINLIEYDL